MISLEKFRFPPHFHRVLHEINEFVSVLICPNLEKGIWGPQSCWAVPRICLLTGPSFCNDIYQVKEWKCIVEKYFINHIMFKVIFITALSHTTILSIWFHFCRVLSYKGFRKITVGWVWNVGSVFIEDCWFKFDKQKECLVLI